VFFFDEEEAAAVTETRCPMQPDMKSERKMENHFDLFKAHADWLALQLQRELQDCGNAN